MKFSKMFEQSRPIFSVELFPPRTAAGWENLCNRLGELRNYPLDFVSVTYGAGGSTRDKTLELVAELQRQVGTVSVPHFTCIGASRASVTEFLETAMAQGINNIVALRGDRPQEKEAMPLQLSNEFRYANELVGFIHQQYNTQFDIAVAGYPEGHDEAHSLEHDIENLKRKVDAGASLIITQLFFDNRMFYKFRERVRQAGITTPILAGVMPIFRFSQIERITSFAKVTVPQLLQRQLLAYEDDSADQRAVGIEYSIQQARDLLENDVDGLHIYALNNWHTLDQMYQGVRSFYSPTKTEAMV